MKYFIFVMLLSIPLAVLGMLASPNEYKMMGINGAVDCDGPLSVLIFAIPALIVYLAGLMAFARSAYYGRRRIRDILIAIVAVLICIGLSNSIAAAVKEFSSMDQESNCGRGL